MAKTGYRKNKTMRNVLICVIAAIVIAAVVFLVALTQKDATGMNCFQRKATAASADGVKINMSEYRITFDGLMRNYQNTTFTDAELRIMQENAVEQALLQKVYAVEAKKLGLSLTDEQKAACEKTAQEQIDSLEKYLAENLIEGGNYSKSILDKRLNSYYQQLGMSKGEYYAFVRESAEANYYSEALESYYTENGVTVDDETLKTYYREQSEASMVTKDADGTETPTYQDGQFWYALMLYRYGMSMPMSYVPEGFIYVDFIKLQKDSSEEINEIIQKVQTGELSFDELLESEDNKDDFRAIIPGPYAIGENDHTQLFSSEDAYKAAAELAVGEIGIHVEQPVSNDDGTQTVTAYLFRGAEGKMCVDGDTGLIDIDYFQGVRSYYENLYRKDQWLADMKISDAVYGYKGADQ